MATRWICSHVIRMLQKMKLKHHQIKVQRLHRSDTVRAHDIDILLSLSSRGNQESGTRDRFVSSQPLDGGRRLARDVEHHPIDTLHLVGDPV